MKSIWPPNHTQEDRGFRGSHHSPAHKILLQGGPGMGLTLLLHSSAHPIAHQKSLDFPL